MTNKENNYRLWTWLSENPENEKRDWPEWEFNGGTVPEVKFLCFACEEAGGMSGMDCRECPIKWDNKKPNYSMKMLCINNNTIYDAWEYYKYLEMPLEKRASLAVQIRDMWK